MPTQPASIDTTKYRQVEYISGRILQARELLLQQSLESDSPANGKFDLGSLYKTGATMNVRAVINGGSVSLVPIDSANPMLVYLNGSWEAFTTPVMTFQPQANGLRNTIYLNYVLWRVSATGAAGSLTDPSLIDTDTQQPAAEMGQLQIYVGANDSGAVDTALMFDRNTTPIPMIILQWDGSGVLSVFQYVSVKPQALASPQRPGLVSTSTTASVVVSDDDPRNTNQRVPLDASVNSQKVSVPQATGAGDVVFADQTGTAVHTPVVTVATTPTAPGINAKLSFYDVWGTTVSDALSLIWSKLTNVYGVLQGMLGRIIALEQKALQDLTVHVGKDLGLPATHPPIVKNTDPATVYPGFEVWGAPSSNPSAQGAYDVLDAGGTKLGSIDFSGNYSVTNPAVKPTLQSSEVGDFSSYVGFANFMLNYVLAQKHAAPPVLGLSGDVSGATNASSVNRIQGRPVSNAVPRAGSVFRFDGSAWQVADFPTPDMQSMVIAGGRWIIATFFNSNVHQVQFAVGQGVTANGDSFTIPPGFDPNNMVFIASPNGYTETGHPAHGILNCSVTPGTTRVNMIYADASGNQWGGNANWFAFGWRAN